MKNEAKDEDDVVQDMGIEIFFFFWQDTFQRPPTEI